MTRMQFTIALIVMAVAGLAGGALVNLFPAPMARAQDSMMITTSELRLVDESGRTRALLSLLRGRPRLIMTDDNGEFRIEIGLSYNGNPALWLRDSEGKPRIQLALNATENPNMILSDSNGRGRIALGLGADDSPAMILRDHMGRDRLALWQESQELGLALADEEGRPRAGLAIKEGRKPTLSFHNSKGKVIWYAPRR